VKYNNWITMCIVFTFTLGPGDYTATFGVSLPSFGVFGCVFLFDLGVRPDFMGVNACLGRFLEELST
jgi:membrane associated rhomboid family serine protease